LYRRLPWLSLVILVAVAGAFAIASNGTEEDWFSGPVVESKPRLAAEPSEEPKPGVAAPEVSKDQSAELLAEQVAVLPAPLGHPERAVAERANNFENAPAEIVEPRTRRDVARPPRHRKLAVSVQRRRPQSGWLLVGTGQGWRVMWRQAGHQLPFSSVPWWSSTSALPRAINFGRDRLRLSASWPYSPFARWRPFKFSAQ